MPFQGTDRRLRTRYKARLPFVLKNNGQEVSGITRNISLLGISAFTQTQFSQVEPVQCLLNIPKRTHPLIARGTIIRCEPLSQPNPDGSYEIGVFFKDFDGRDESELSGFLRQLQEQEQTAVQAGYRALKQRLEARRKRKQAEIQERRKRKLLRLRRRRKKLAQKTRRKAGRPRKSARSARKSSS